MHKPYAFHVLYEGLETQYRSLLLNHKQDLCPNASKLTYSFMSELVSQIMNRNPSSRIRSYTILCVCVMQPYTCRGWWRSPSCAKNSARCISPPRPSLLRNQTSLTSPPKFLAGSNAPLWKAFNSCKHSFEKIPFVCKTDVSETWSWRMDQTVPSWFASLPAWSGLQ